MSDLRTIADLQERTDLDLITLWQDVDSVKEQLGGTRASEFDSFFVKVEEGEYTEVYGFVGSVPYLYKLITKVL